jgi:nitroimidazol reductase NimA-like FMN-containing flavoprotein (pyridoxamine 5'-phosphate oxidase superfamily)
MSDFTPTERTQVKRLPKRGKYERETVFAILDGGFVCHVGFSVDGQPYVIPTNYGRSGDTLYLHGSAASRMLRTLSEGVRVSVTVTHVDGLVLARSAFHHSVNYRSVVILGTARLVTDRAEKMEALRVFTEHVMKGRCRSKKSAPRCAPAARLTMKRITLCRCGQVCCRSRPWPRHRCRIRNERTIGHCPIT